MAINIISSTFTLRFQHVSALRCQTNYNVFSLNVIHIQNQLTWLDRLEPFAMRSVLPRYCCPSNKARWKCRLSLWFWCHRLGNASGCLVQNGESFGHKCVSIDSRWCAYRVWRALVALSSYQPNDSGLMGIWWQQTFPRGSVHPTHFGLDNGPVRNRHGNTLL